MESCCSSSAGKCSAGCCGCKVGCALVTIGALNWGLVGIGYFAGGDWNVVHMILGSLPVLENIVYVLVGLAAVAKLGKFCKCCKKSA